MTSTLDEIRREVLQTGDDSIAFYFKRVMLAYMDRLEEEMSGLNAPVIFTAQIATEGELPLTGSYGEAQTGDRIFSITPGFASDCGLWIVNTDGEWTRAPELPEGATLLEGSVFIVGGNSGRSNLDGQFFINNFDYNDNGTADHVIGTDWFRLRGFGTLDYLRIFGTAQETGDQLGFNVTRQGSTILLETQGGVMIWNSVPDPQTGYIWTLRIPGSGNSRGTPLNDDVWGISPHGHETNWANSEPADEDIQPGQVYSWFDATDGAAKFNRKGKTLDGTVVRMSSPMT
jgi:hypothetical protein